MKFIHGPWALIAAAALLAALLGLIALALPLPGMDWLIPAPENAAEGLAVALGAHRYEGAMNQLSQDLREQVSKDDLIQMMQALEKTPLKGIQDAHGQDSQEQGDTAAARVEVEFGDNSKRVIEFPLVKENQTWKVSSIEPLRGLGR